jgi:hypothetical protein
MARLTAGSIRAVTEKYAPLRRQAPVNAAPYNPESARATIVAAHPAARAVPIASAVKLAAPRGGLRLRGGDGPAPDRPECPSRARRNVMSIESIRTWS